MNINDSFYANTQEAGSRINNRLNKIIDNKVASNIWGKNYRLWNDKPDEVSNRLGWLDSADVMLDKITEINQFTNEMRSKGIKHALLIGMGGSSLAPEVFRDTFGVKSGYLDLAVVDSTHPKTIKIFLAKYKPDETLYVVSTKSGGTVETISLMKLFYSHAVKKMGVDKASNHFIAITDPGSGLEKIAVELKFAKIFLNDPNIGGRYSALSFFGLLPAGLIGVDLNKLIERVLQSAHNSKFDNRINIPLAAGAVIGEMTLLGKDKLTFVLSEEIKSFGSWVEQLIAESTGKIGKGIVPVYGEILVEPEYYLKDRLFVYMHLKNDESKTNHIKALSAKGHPVIEIVLNDIYDLGREYFNWMFTTAVAGHILNIQPFDQPDVESAKILARKMMSAYLESGSLPAYDFKTVTDTFNINLSVQAEKLSQIISEFVSQNVSYEDPVSYAAIQAYMNPDNKLLEIFSKLRSSIQREFKIATTVGIGPRFLHSTGQLHKGDSGNGIFIQFTEELNENLIIPDDAINGSSSVSFDVLITSQAMGDRQALLDKKRKILHIHFKEDAAKVLANEFSAG